MSYLWNPEQAACDGHFLHFVPFWLSKKLRGWSKRLSLLVSSVLGMWSSSKFRGSFWCFPPASGLSSIYNLPAILIDGTSKTFYFPPTSTQDWRKCHSVFKFLWSDACNCSQAVLGNWDWSRVACCILWEQAHLFSAESGGKNPNAKGSLEPGWSVPELLWNPTGNSRTDEYPGVTSFLKIEFKQTKFYPALVYRWMLWVLWGAAQQDAQSHGWHPGETGGGFLTWDFPQILMLNPAPHSPQKILSAKRREAAAPWDAPRAGRTFLHALRFSHYNVICNIIFREIHANEM